ncbi:MAG TPA: HD domain-containing phosphohydrolase [Candidatus Competibacteraceae bacterium]|nr:HD domain-containing phosphohydrolase [Candidatus Competibacteraceae bacterium]
MNLPIRPPIPGQLPLHIHIATLFISLILALGGAVIWNNYVETTRLMLHTADERFERIADRTGQQLHNLFVPVAMTVDLLAWQQLATATALEERLNSLSYLREALATAKHLSALFIGYNDGDFFLLRTLPVNSPLRPVFDVPEPARYLAQSVERDDAGAVTGTFLFYDAHLNLLRRDDRPDYVFDPRDRPWYRLARDRPDRIYTEPYLFFTTREVGATLARRAATGAAVVGADLTLQEISTVLAVSRFLPDAQLALFDDRYQVIAYPEPDRLLYQVKGQAPRLALLSELHEPALTTLERDLRDPEQRSTRLYPEGFTLDIAGRAWRGQVKTLITQDGKPLYLALFVPQSELLADAVRIRNQSVLIAATLVLLALPITWLLAGRIAGHLKSLVNETAQIRHFQFQEPIAVRSIITEVNQLARAMALMKSTIRRFLDISAALAAEQNFDHLLDRVLAETLALAQADAGLLLLVSDDERELQPAAARLRNEANPVTATQFAMLPLTDPAPHPLIQAMQATAPQVRPLTVSEPLADYLAPLTGALTERASQLIIVPLRNRQEEPVGVLALLKSQAVDAKGVSAELLAFIAALSGTSAVSIENQRLLHAQKNLFEAFIRLLADAIDAKSPYTGGHCARVPELTKLLARAACASQDEPFHDFSLNAAEWEELHIACWLHDCGKITTPEYVVDKATKLETIHDRIHEVRMRFEVLKRDAEIVCWRQIAAGGDAISLQADLQAQWRALDEEFAFIARCNQGGEFMSAEQIAQVRQVAERTWLRTLDDRLGLSHEELARKECLPAQPLPVVEPLLADKPEHRFARGPQDRIEPDNLWGFQLDVPEWLYDRGELHSLCVSRGTLTGEERYKINEHIVQTIIMLSRLPFPKPLRRVPEIAGGHHEKMDGTGYPKRLHREQMSIPARMMAIADIFEALTAIDRPYKSGKTLSEALQIMARMRDEQHIDAALFELFLRSGVYRQYAEGFLQPGQIDEVRVEDYLAANRKTALPVEQKRNVAQQ